MHELASCKRFAAGICCRYGGPPALFKAFFGAKHPKICARRRRRGSIRLRPDWILARSVLVGAFNAYKRRFNAKPGTMMADAEFLDRILTMEIGRCTEAAAVAACKSLHS